MTSLSIALISCAQDASEPEAASAEVVTTKATEHVSTVQQAAGACSSEETEPRFCDMFLGEGYHPVNGPTGTACFNNGTYNVDYEMSENFWSTTTFRETHVREQFEIKGGLSGVDLGFLTASAEAAYETISSSESNEELFFMVSEKTTVERLWEPPFVIEGNCINTPSGELSDFIDACGAAYAKKQVLGGHIVVAINLANVSQEVRDAIRADSSLGLFGVGFDLKSTLERLDAVDSTTIELYYESDGILLGLPSGTDHDINSIINALDQFEPDSNAVANNDPSHPSYGSKVFSNQIQAYHVVQFQQCGLNVPQLVQDAWKCYRDSQAALEKLHDGHELQTAYDGARDMLSKHQDYDWDNIQKQDTQELITAVEECRSDFSGAELPCDDEMYTASYSNVCSACVSVEDLKDEGCHADDLVGAFETVFSTVNELPPAPSDDEFAIQNCRDGQCIVPIVVRNSGSGSITYDREDFLCSFAGMAGKFEGGGEGVRVRPSGSDWNLERWSQRTAASERVTGHMACTDRGNFLYNQGVSWLDDLMVVEDVNNSSSTASLPSGYTSEYVGAVAGITGKMKGGGEKSFVQPEKNDPDYNRLEVASQQGWLEGYATYHGLETGNDPEFALWGGQSSLFLATHPEHAIEKKVGDLTRSHCHIYQVSGDFDGAGEQVQLIADETLGVWRVRARAGCKDRGHFGDILGTCDEWKKVRIGVKCYAYDQR